MGGENISEGNKKILGINKYVYGLFPHMDHHKSMAVHVGKIYPSLLIPKNIFTPHFFFF